MIVIEIIKSQNGKLVELKVEGHAGYGSFGEDIVCSAVSVLTQTAVLGLLNVACIDLKYKISDGLLYFKIPKALEGQKKIQTDAIVQTMVLGLKNISDSYLENIRIVEKEEV